MLVRNTWAALRLVTCTVLRMWWRPHCDSMTQKKKKTQKQQSDAVSFARLHKVRDIQPADTALLALAAVAEEEECSWWLYGGCTIYLAFKVRRINQMQQQAR